MSEPLTKLIPRAWQQRAKADFCESQERGLKNYLAYVTPGAGKTFFALQAGARLLESDDIRQLVIVVHTHNLRLQWMETAALHGLVLTDAIERSSEQDGFVLTYQQLSDPTVAEQVHEVVRGTRRTLCVLDEVHHVADSAAWGDGVRIAFRACWRRLLLSGTPFRRDEARIPFVEYRAGIARPSFSYGYADALRDGIVAPIYFPTFDGLAKWRFGDQEFHEQADGHRAKSHQDRHLNTLLESENWLKVVLKAANERLTELRSHQPNAAGLVVAKDQNHARRVHEILSKAARSKRIGLAISDDNDAHDVIEDFRSGDDPWLVAVRMVSEGVDIPRLRVGVYASNYRTELFFRQVVGRFIRIADGWEEQSAFLYLPQHELLSEYAKMLSEDRLAVLRTSEPIRRSYVGGGRAVNSLDALSAKAIESAVVLPGSEFSREEIERATLVRSTAGLAHLPIEVVASLLRASETVPQT